MIFQSDKNRDKVHGLAAEGKNLDFQVIPQPKSYI